MQQELSARLSKVLEQKRRKQKLKRDLEALEAELGQTSARLTVLEAGLEKENVDVQKLEGMSLTALFYWALGSREQQLEKERQELLSAQLKYGQTRRQLEFLQRDRDDLAAQLEELAEVEAEYQFLLAEKEGVLRQSHPALTPELLRLSEQTAELQAQGREITEAIEAGKRVIAGLEQVIASLESAGNWGVWDIFGGGFLSTFLKHSRIDEARAQVEDVQAQMSRFNRELADVRQKVDLQIDIGNFASFADFFFDGLIADWVVQSRIDDSFERSRQARETIAGAVRELEGMQKRTQAQLDETQDARARLIERT